MGWRVACSTGQCWCGSVQRWIRLTESKSNLPSDKTPSFTLWKRATSQSFPNWKRCLELRSRGSLAMIILAKQVIHQCLRVAIGISLMPSFSRLTFVAEIISEIIILYKYYSTLPIKLNIYIIRTFSLVSIYIYSLLPYLQDFFLQQQ